VVQRIRARVLDAAPPVRLLESRQVAVGDLAEEADVLEAVAGHLLAEGVVEAPAGHDEVHAAPVAVGDGRRRARVASWIEVKSPARPFAVPTRSTAAEAPEAAVAMKAAVSRADAGRWLRMGSG
jgi:hypothetical protein